MAMALAAVAAATSSVAMSQKATQAEHHSSYGAASSSSALGVRRISVSAGELRSHFILSRIGAATLRRPFVIAATAGEISRYDVKGALLFLMRFCDYFVAFCEIFVHFWGFWLIGRNFLEFFAFLLKSSRICSA